MRKKIKTKTSYELYFNSVEKRIATAVRFFYAQIQGVKVNEDL